MTTSYLIYKKYLTSGAFGLVLTAAVFLSGCGKSTSADPNSNANNPTDKTVEVATAKAETRPVGSFLQATGSLIADDSSDVSSQVAGQVFSTPIDVGAYVSQGAVIIQLNTRDAELRLQQAQAGKEQSLAALNQAKAKIGLGEGGKFDPNSVPEVLSAYQNYQATVSQIRTAEANLENTESQLKLALDTARRYGNLARTGDASQLLYTQYKSQADQAQTQVNAARENVKTLQAQSNASRRQYEVAINTAKQNNQGVESAEANLKNARAQTALAQKAVTDSTIRAPFSGFISERKVSAGEYITPSTPVVTLVRTNPIKLNLQIPEAETAKVNVGMSVSITVSAYTDRSFAGRVTAIKPSLETASRAVVVEAQIDNAENLLRPNMFATGRLLQAGGENGIFVPKSAVIEDRNTNSRRVFTIVDGAARLVVIQTGEEEGDAVRVTSGLDGTETVATTNVNQLFDSVPVRVAQ